MLCLVNVHEDTVTNMFLIGVSMYGNDLKKRGRKNLFTKGVWNWHQFLEHPENIEDTQFGSAIAPCSGINMDGFNDAIIGSSLENQNYGAVYISHGHEGTILVRYSQKILGSSGAFWSHL